MYNFDNVAALGESAGTTVKDLSQYNNTGTVNGATWNTTGKRGGDYIFNGTSSYIQTNTTCSGMFVDNQNFTLSARVKITAYPASSSLKAGII